MAKYEPGDIVTYYFIISDEDGHSNIKAWTDNKDLAKFYLEFHKCKNFRLKKFTKPIEEISKILEENRHDDIMLANVVIKNPNHKKGKETKMVVIPLTQTEQLFINEETTNFMSSRIDYGYLNGVIPYLKKKYQHAIEKTLLQDIIKLVVHGCQSSIVQSIQFDHVMVLFRSFPDNFGR